jgi:hypothetical protein
MIEITLYIKVMAISFNILKSLKYNYKIQQISSNNHK